MNLTILGKVLGGLVATSATAVGGYFIYDALNQGDDVTFFVSSKQLENNVADNFNKDKKNYKCQFENENAFDCTISLSVVDTTKNQSKIEQFMQDATDQSKLTLDKLKVEGNLYKVTANYKAKKIDYKKILKLMKTDENGKITDKHFVKLDLLFAVVTTTESENKKYSILENTKSKYFIIKGETNKTLTWTNGNKYQCSSKESNGIIKKHDCNVYGLGDNSQDIQALTVTKIETSTENVSIAAGKHYLVELKDAVEINKVNNIVINNTSNNTGTATYETVISAFYKKLSGDDFYLFIFK